MKSYNFGHAAAVLFAGVVSACIAAEEKPALTQPTKFRVIGLFSPDRQDDLREVVARVPGVKLVSVDYPNAEATFTYDLVQLFPQAKPKQAFTSQQIAEQLDNLLKAASFSTFGVKVPTEIPKDKLTAVEILVVGLDCKACALAAYEAVAKIDGVEQATASFKEGRVTARIDSKKTDRAKLEAALKSAQVQLKNP